MGKRARDDSFSSTPSSSSDQELELELDSQDKPNVVIHCSLPPHRPLIFLSQHALDLHYANEHTNRCSACARNFPSAHLLDLHLDENHNSFREILAAQGEKTYACFVDDCTRKCSSPRTRRLHLIDKHAFPKNYNFRAVDTGIDKVQSMLQSGRKRRVSINSFSNRRRSATDLSFPLQTPTREQFGKSTEDDFDPRPKAADEAVDSIALSLAALRFIPPSIQARHRHHQHRR